MTKENYIEAHQMDYMIFYDKIVIVVLLYLSIVFFLNSLLQKTTLSSFNF